MLVCGFPGVGKSFLSKNSEACVDSDSSSFSWSQDGTRNVNFPDNYIYHIRSIPCNKIVFLSTHKTVRSALVNNSLKYTLIYPERSLKNEYIERYRNRGSSDKFITLMCDSWDNFITEMEEDTADRKIVLKTGQFLTLQDIINKQHLIGLGHDVVSYDVIFEKFSYRRN